MDNVEISGSQAVVTPESDIVASSAEEFKAAIKSLVDQGVDVMTLDISGVNMMDSIGVGLLVAVHNTLASKGGKLTVAKANPDIYDLLTVMRLDRHFTITRA